MSRTLEGKNATLRISIPGTGAGYLPVACATGVSFSSDQEIVDKTTPQSGRNKEFTTGLGEWAVTLASITHIVPETQMLTSFDLMMESVRRNPVDIELSFSDDEGNTKTLTGKCVIPHIGINAPADGFVEDEIELKGSGNFTIGTALITAPENNNEVKNYEYTATGGETAITYSDLIGRTVLGVWRGYPLDIITAGTPTDVQVKFNSGAGQLIFSSPLSGGEYILILYK